MSTKTVYSIKLPVELRKMMGEMKEVKFGYTFNMVKRRHKNGDKNKRSPEEDEIISFTTEILEEVMHTGILEIHDRIVVELQTIFERY